MLTGSRHCSWRKGYMLVAEEPADNAEGLALSSQPKETDHRDNLIRTGRAPMGLSVVNFAEGQLEARFTKLRKQVQPLRNKKYQP